jgi:CBS domain-containing protein
VAPIAQPAAGEDRMTKAPETVGELMTTDVVMVDPDDSVEAAVEAMVDRDIGSVVVASGYRPVGMFTERDLLRCILDDPRLLERPVGDVMTQPVVTARPDQEVVDAFELMNANEVRRLPVVDAGRLVGIVTERDLLRWVGQVAHE